jgi:hypothetical protein
VEIEQLREREEMGKVDSDTEIADCKRRLKETERDRDGEEGSGKERSRQEKPKQEAKRRRR